MEYANMQSLEKATNALEFLSHLHNHNLVHCNIKPSNILFSQIEEIDIFIPKICDFAMSMEMEMMKTSIEIGGTPFFHPPEVRNRKGNYDGGVDIWGLVKDQKEELIQMYLKSKMHVDD
ncbi:MAG: hypothetical protein EZS28_052082 [Streblomastix strix]|uniref:Protein kinase domain-containing protein n=1 Tax=Streblomastix strix TaxID=222440 RepID=A0A5J4SMD3_9EUKA|nr:MAG: hypothetical protein EZS28_052082 [Streblomastix strix]